MAFGVRDEKFVPQDCESGRPLQFAGDFKLQFALLIKRQHFSERRVGHKNGRAVAGNGHGRLKPDFADRLPANPFFPGQIEKTDGAGTRVRDEQVSRIIQ